jgi:hypothetical protein
MKKALLLLACLAMGLPLLADIAMDGSNYAQYAYRAAVDSLHNYFYDELTFRLRYQSLTSADLHGPHAGIQGLCRRQHRRAEPGRHRL